MEGTHLGDGMSDRVVDSSPGNFTTGDMSHRNRERQCRRYRCKSLEAIAEDNQYVRTMAGICLSETDYTKADGLADGFGSIGSDKHLDSLRNLKIPLDIAHRQAKI